MTINSALNVQVAQLSGYAVVTATGSIDATTRALLDEYLDQALELTRLAVIVDLSEVTFCDSTGLNSFVQAHRKATTRGVIVVAAGLRNLTEYVFAVTRLEEAFYSQPDLDAAVNWLENGYAARDNPPHTPAT
ncbi:MAG TPA: STAS domain-containing protein [Streptosporangiaceae bacterium]|jgi:anti-sigma B factor antagonist